MSFPQARVEPDPVRSHRFLGVLLLVEVIVAGTLFLVPRGLGTAIVKEAGPVETATVVLYGLAAVLTVVVAARVARSTGIRLFILIAAFACREMDFHDKFTVMGVDRIKFYTSPEVPLAQKLVVVLILLFVLVVAMGLLGGWRGFLNDLRNKRAYAVTAAVAFVLLVVSQIGDKTQHFLTFDRQYSPEENFPFAVQIVEETLELLFPALLSLALVQWMRDRRPR